MSIWSASSARRARSPASCNASGARATRSAALPKGRLFPLSRDELVECAALLDSVRRGELDRLTIPDQPLDVLAQQIVAEVAAQDWHEDELFALCRRAWPYRALAREDFTAVVRMLAEGFTTRRGRRGALIHHDAVNHMLRGRRGARLTALTSGGTIPDTADYQVVLEPENQIDRHGQRGLRRREPGRRRLPARQQRLSHHARRARHRAGGGRARPGADHSVLARRGARPQRRTVAVGVAAARRRSPRGCGADRRRRDASSTGSIDDSRHRRARRASSSSNIWPPSLRGAGLPADPGHDRARALLRRSRRHAARHPFALSAAGSTAPGAWRCASASAASSTSNCRRRRPRTTSCCR